MHSKKCYKALKIIGKNTIIAKLQMHNRTKEILKIIEKDSKQQKYVNIQWRRKKVSTTKGERK